MSPETTTIKCMDICKKCIIDQCGDWHAFDKEDWNYFRYGHVHCPKKYETKSLELFPPTKCPFRAELIIIMQIDNNYPESSIMNRAVK